MTKAAASNLSLLHELEAQTLELVRNAIILHPDYPAHVVAQFLWAARHETDVIPRFGVQLTVRYLVHAIQAERRKKHPRPSQPPLFPGLINLPRRIHTPEGKRPPLAKATATEIRAYVKQLNARHRERIEDLQKLLEIMGKYITTRRGITPAEVAQIERGESISISKLEGHR